MRPEDVTGIDSRGVRVHVDGCTCDYNELTHREWVKGGPQLALKVTVERPIFRVDPGCKVHGYTL